MPLSSPVTAIALERSSGTLGCAASVSMQGVRSSHEDAHVLESGLGFAAVFDGHSGDDASVFAAERLPLHYRSHVHAGCCSPGVALQRAFSDCEAEMFQTLPAGCEAGTTATAAVVRTVGHDVYSIHIANCGDSRAVLWRRSSDTIVSTRDHRPDDQAEKDRIEAAGGIVWDDFDPPRIDGMLACSRALGSFGYKNGGKEPAFQKVSCIPDMYEWEASAGDILLIACDGVFDTISNDQLVTKVCRADTICDLGTRLAGALDLCISKDCDDNMTLVAFELASDVEPASPSVELTVGGFTKEKDPEVLDKYTAFCKRFGFEIRKEFQKRGPPIAVLETLPPSPGRFADLPEPQAATVEEFADQLDTPLVVKVTAQKPLAAVLAAARHLLEGDHAAMPQASIEVQGLGNAVPNAASVALALNKEGFRLVRVSTDYPVMRPLRPRAGAEDLQVARLRLHVRGKSPAAEM